MTKTFARVSLTKCKLQWLVCLLACHIYKLLDRVHKVLIISTLFCLPRMILDGMTPLSWWQRFHSVYPERFVASVVLNTQWDRKEMQKSIKQSGNTYYQSKRIVTYRANKMRCYTFWWPVMRAFGCLLIVGSQRNIVKSSEPETSLSGALPLIFSYLARAA
jgi:hypothetical protein